MMKIQNAYRVALTPDHICVQSPYKGVDVCRAVAGGRYAPEWKCWIWPRQERFARALVDAFGSRLTKAAGGAALLALLPAAAPEPVRVIVTPETIPGLKTTPWKHQREAYALASSLPGSMLAMWMGCIDGDALVTINRQGKGGKITLKELHRKFHGGATAKRRWRKEFPTDIRSLCGDWFGKNRIINVVDSGKKDTVLLTLLSGKTLNLTPDHEVLTPTGYVAASALTSGDGVLTNGTMIDKDGYVRVFGVDHPRKTTSGVYEHILVAEELIGRAVRRDEHIHHKNGVRHDNRPDNLEVMCAREHQRRHGMAHQSNLDGGTGRYIPKVDTVVRVEPGGVKHTYDVICADPHRNFVANGIVVHNCGKTLVSISLISTTRISLIICPKSVISVWPLEFAKHASVQPEIVLLNKGTCEAKSKLIAGINARATAAHPVVVILNYEAAWREPLASELLKVAHDVVILDEIHKIKAASGKASKFCSRLRRSAARMVGLTGTPMPHSPVDIYGQYRALDPRVFGTNVHTFKQHYVITGGFGGHETLGYKNQEEMRQKFLSIAYQADRSVIELPDATHTVIPVELGAKAMKAYKQLAHDLYAAVEGGEVTAANALVKLLRLQQLTGGYLKLDDVERLVEMDTEKREALGELLESIGSEPVVVFCRFRTDLDAAHLASKALGLSSLELSGRANALAEWQQGAGQVLAVQIKSGGVGVDLTRASYCVYYSLGFSLGDFEQSLCRVHRFGQKNAVSYYHLICEGTVDRQVYDALDARRDVVATILEGIKHS